MDPSEDTHSQRHCHSRNWNPLEGNKWSNFVSAPSPLNINEVSIDTNRDGILSVRSSQHFAKAVFDLVLRTGSISVRYLPRLCRLSSLILRRLEQQMIASGLVLEVGRTQPVARASLVDRKIFRGQYWRSIIRHGTRVDYTKERNTHLMEKVDTESFQRIQCVNRRCLISSFSVDLLEILSKKPLMHVLFIPGNPGIVSYYSDFIEALYENLGGNASVTVIGHTAQGRKAVANGRLFSLQEQIDHKVDFIEQEMRTSEIPVVLIGHSIGAYIGLEIFKRVQQKVKVYVGLYPFLTLNKNSLTQSTIGMVARYSILSRAVSLLVSLIGSLPTHILERIVKRLLGPSWSFTAIDATCTHLLRYHTMRNVLYMAMTEFRELSEEPDWLFMRQTKDQIAFLFGDDDHWGPLTHFEEISRHIPGIDLSVEREGWTHSFSCTMAGSVWVARYVADIIRNKTGAEINN